MEPGKLGAKAQVMPERFSGAVLCGGQSQRFGSDKATYAHNGTPLAKISLLALREAGASEVFSIGGDVTALADMGFRAVPDDYPGEGPLGGIICALSRAADGLSGEGRGGLARAGQERGGPELASRERAGGVEDRSSENICVVLACDLPWASATTVNEVVRELASDQHLNAVLPIGEDDIPQYLHGAWRLRCLPSLKAAFVRGGRSVNDGLVMLAEGTIRLCRVSSMKSLEDMDEMP